MNMAGKVSNARYLTTYIYSHNKKMTSVVNLPRYLNGLFSPMNSGWVSGWAGIGKKFVQAVSQKPYGVGSWRLVGTLVGGYVCNVMV